MAQLQLYLLGHLRLFVGERQVPFKTLPKTKSRLRRHLDNLRQVLPGPGSTQSLKKDELCQQVI